MTMFAQPLQRNSDAPLASQLLTLYDAYCEFQCYCAFLHQAHAGIAAQDLEMDEEVVVGISMSGRCLMRRSQQIKLQLREILSAAQEEAKQRP